MWLRKIRELCDSLITVSPDTLERMAILDSEGKFNEHVDPINYDMCEPVGANYPYIKKPLKLRIKYFFIYNFIVRLYEPRELKAMGYSVEGKENIKGIKRAVCTCNHVNKLDCVLMRKTFRGKKFYITAATFNNMKGILGDIMRSCRMMPMSDDREGMANFIKSVNTLLNGNNFVLFYPERSEWWCYKKPRPLEVGAFHFAAKNNVPVIPSFVTFKENGRVDKFGTKLFDMKVNVLKPIYPKEGLSFKEQTIYLKEQNELRWKECYEKTYGVPLVLNPKKED